MPAAKKKRKTPPKAKVAAPIEERSFGEIIRSVGSDWIVSNLQIDAEVYQNVIPLLLLSRQWWRENPYAIKYAEQLNANIFGENGIMLRSKVKETEDRVVNSPDEKWALIAYERRIDRVRQWAAKQSGREIAQYRAFKLADQMERSLDDADAVIRGKATIQVGAPDVFANQRIEGGWSDWQRAEFCDIRGRRNYNMLRQIRLWAAARDGGHFIRLIKDTRANKYGFALQQINDEWCDYFRNVTLDNTDVIRMGIRYPMTAWGIGKPTSFSFVKRIPRDWQTGARYMGGQYGASETWQEVPADQVIHYARFTDIENTRPAPWGVSVFGKSRHLDQAELAAVVAARAEACKTGFLYSDLVPEGGQGVGLELPTSSCINNAARGIKMMPGGMYGLPYGVKFQSNDPTHPSGNFSGFRQAMGQATCAGLPGADYNVIFNDLNMSFSSGRIGRLDTNEVSKTLQRFDIDTAERPIFEAWLEMALITGAISLPSTEAKYQKFNRPLFQGRRWAQIDETKAVTAAALRIANHMSSLGRENAELGQDFEEIMLERAEELMLMDSLGIDPAFTVSPATPTTEVSDDEESGDAKPANKPAAVAAEPAKKNGSKGHRNATDIESLLQK